MKFIFALNSWTQNCLFLRFRRLPEQTRMQKYTYGNFANFNPRAIVNTSSKRTMRCKITYFTRQRFARAIIDAETKTVREYFAHFRYQPPHFVHILFINAY